MELEPTAQVSPELEVDPATHPPEIDIEVDLTYDPHVNYAMHQNAVPVVKELCVTNRGGAPIEDLELEIWAEPDLAARCSANISIISAGNSHRLNDLEPTFSPQRLVNQAERERGLIHLQATLDGKVVHQSQWSLDVLAYNEWAGSRSLPEILAAFVLPNHPAVERLLVAAREHLMREVGESALSGYQRKDPGYVRKMVKAIYQASCDLGLSYSNPPASFETTGQKIRTPDRIVDLGMATCLDLAVFLAAAMEQAGLHPVILLLDGHAFPGCWLEDECFVDSTIDDAARVRKRVALDQIVVFETTCVTHTPPPSFETACQQGRQHLESPEKFCYAVDVRTARREQIRPIQLRVQGDEFEAVPVAGPVAPEHVPPEAMLHSQEADSPSAEAPEVKEDPADRIERWKRKLLDLSLRNRFLNFRDTKKSVPLLCPDLFKFEDLLAGRRKFSLQPQPKVMSEQDPRDPAYHQRTTGEDAVEEYLRSQVEGGQLHAGLPPGELEKRLTHISREAKLNLEEGGANTLYLGMGFLNWYESESSDLPRKAPILLLPVVLTRDVVKSAYRLELADEDPRANVTLLQKIEADFGIKISGLKDLDTDESGLDVKAILDRVRRAILHLPKWDVTEDLTLGLFSFNKYLMWLDLEVNADKLLENPVVRHLVEKPREEFEPGATFPDARTLDEDTHPGDTFCPLDADSTQMSAIHAAAKGRTFVLEGPPGTGKSQTITNLIAHTLAAGKRVLFVSEKMAALNVVRKRLENVGLGPFCLEIHSNKAQKRMALDQMKAALEFQRSADPEDWRKRTDSLATVRAELNEYTSVLHRSRSFGRSARDGIAQLIRLHGAPSVPLDFGSATEVDRERFDRLHETVHELQVVLAEVEDPGSHPFRDVGKTEWTPILKDRVDELSRQLANAAKRLASAATGLAEVMKARTEDHSIADLRLLVELGELLAASPAPPERLLLEQDWVHVESSVKGWLRIVSRHREVHAKLASRYRPEMADLDLDQIRSALAEAKQKKWPFSWLRSRKSVGELKGVLAGGKLARGPQLLRDLDLALERNRLRSQLGGEERAARDLLGRHWSGVETDCPAVQSALDWCGQVRALLNRLTGEDLAARKRLREACVLLALEGRDLLAEGGATLRKLQTLREALVEVEGLRRDIHRLLERADDSPAELDSPHFAERVKEQAERWNQNLLQLRGWCLYLRTRVQAEAVGLGALVCAVESGDIRPRDLPAAFEHSFYRWWVNQLFEAEPALRRFTGREHEDRIRRFRNLEQTIADDTPSQIQDRLSERIPKGGTRPVGNGSSEMGILRRELQKQRAHMPIRRLFQSIPNVICRLKPCFLMSPLSVAQYLDLGFPDFDLVVFDEASQMPVWDSVGAIRRGKSLIVVGDSKQLPPTNFFQRAEEGEELFEEDIAELESILDECIAAGLPRLHLGWHYRSRHESLIAFSNHHYYENHLLTFPSPQRDTKHLGLSWRHVEEGVYDRGKSRANLAEAEAVVAEIVERLKSPRREESIGVVTFSQAQQTKIEDLLDRARRENPEIDRFFTAEVEEPVFVKNLENVQGDERDVILFSICYGPDRTGKVAMNFGPLNRDGGERRLNVAVTRAKRQVILFSSLTADHIDLARTNSLGVRHLKAYLEYADKGDEALGRELGVFGDAEAESPFEEEVIRALVERGFDVQPQVGCSGYRIDIGIKDPERPGRFLLGVECDGAMYHSAKTARDRDRLRAAVLESLGWRLHRIWSTDWWQDPKVEMEKLVAAIESARNSPRKAAEVSEPQNSPTQASPQSTQDSVLFASARRQTVPPPGSPPATPQREFTPGDLGGTPYPDAPALGLGGSAEDFYDPASTTDLRGLVTQVLVAEAPIAFTRLARLVAESYDLRRVTARLRQRMKEVLPRGAIFETPGCNESFLWLKTQVPENHDGFRYQVPQDPNKRAAQEVPPQEIANAALAVLRLNVSMGATDLARETAKLFGFKSLGRKVATCMEKGLLILESKDDVVRSDDTLTLL
jgi:very-short-patch-repair endonuclease